MKTCIKCESLIPNHYENCPKCGTSMSEATEATIKDHDSINDKNSLPDFYDTDDLTGAEIYDLDDLQDYNGEF